MRRLILGLMLMQMPLTMTAAQAAPAAAVETKGVLPAAETNALVPSVVYYKGKTAPVQVRNAGAVRFEDGSIFFATLVDTSGYASTVREKYQFYLVTETPIEIGGKRLGAGAYGCGFIEGGIFVVMDLGAHDVMSASTIKDAELKRPRPLQIVAGATAGEYKLELGRQYVSFRQAK